ncbi:hypothetical protein C8Q75DRAFT_310826 [Abortiporus biennis]|nr:hypothetical protein C8Q75DRAFT_310826 [Abortiporus biennis]
MSSWPPVDYTDQIKTQPSSIWSTLLALHNDGQSSILEFLLLGQLSSTSRFLSEAGDKASRRILQQLWTSKLPDVLFRIVLKKPIYTTMTRLHEEYKTSLFQCLYWYLMYLTDVQQVAQMKDTIDGAVKNFLKMWTLIWKHRESFFSWGGVPDEPIKSASQSDSENNEDEEEKFAIYFGELIVNIAKVQSDLEKDVFNRWPDYECPVRHVLLHIWQCSKNKSARALSLSFLNSINYDLLDDELDEFIFNQYLPTQSDIGRFLDRLEDFLMYAPNETSFSNQYTDYGDLWLASHIVDLQGFENILKPNGKIPK